MDIPRFDAANVNPRLILSGIGNAFQEFVHQVLLPEFPRLHRFPGGGKDGAIDLVDTSDGCVAVECKFVGEDDFGEIERRWTYVKDLLVKHLREPSGPTLGQSQYGPWYSSNNPICEYWFCVSGTISNEQQRRTLQKTIADFFRDLAAQRPHLSHLHKLKVEIVDWNDLATRLQKHPYLIFRWFPSSRPTGLVPIDEAVDVGTFRSYLTNAKLPYYSLVEHLRSVPAPISNPILDEETLLNHLDNLEITGLIITGKGGVGKSRLTLELGWLALRRGWSVMRVQSRLKEDALERFAERLTPDQTALLLVDYLETRSDFGELVESINVLNDSRVARLRYVAACRTAYYHKAIAVSERHLPVDLTPPPGSAVQDWFAGYRQKTIERILTEAGLPANENYLRVCHNVPILAVFLAYLHTSGRTEDLAELVDEVEFGRWVSKRVQLTFGERSISRELAELIPLFPMEDSITSQLPLRIFRQIFDKLATDGWVERLHVKATERADTWVTAHDVLADQILVSYVRSIPDTVEVFIGDFLALAGEFQSIRSALVSLQRVSDTVPINTIKWRKVITDAISLNQSAWRDVRDLLLRTTILSMPDYLFLLQCHEELWKDAAGDLGFQKSLGWLARWVVREGQFGITEDDKNALIAWIAKAAPLAERSNFILTWGLRLSPDTLRDTALSWIKAKPTVLHTHYLMVAWIDSGLPVNAIMSAVEQWCKKFSRSFQLSFLMRAWLDAGGEKELVQEAIKDWLVKHRNAAEASHVYKAWLDAGGEKELVREAIEDWLVEHCGDAQARFVYNGWLDAGGEKELVQEAIKVWLVEHRGDIEAQFVYKAWLDARGKKELVQEAINVWLFEHRNKAEASHVYKAWLDSDGEKEFVQEAIKDWLVEHRGDAEAGFVYDAWLNAGGKKEFVQEMLKDWLVEHRSNADAGYVYDAWLNAGGEKEFVRQPIQDWLVQHRNAAEASHVYKAWLDAGGKKTLVREAIRDWLSLHGKDFNSDHVFKSWLESGGEWELVKGAAIAWLSQHRAEESAVYLTKFIAKQPNLPTNTIRDVLTWCRTFPRNEDALWRLTQLGDNLLVVGIAKDLVSSSEAILRYLLPPTTKLGSRTCGQIVVLLVALITSQEIQSGPLRGRVDSLLLSWLKHPLSFGRVPKPFRNIQRIEFLQRIIAFMDSGVLNPTLDHEPLMRFLQWIDEWSKEAKQGTRPLLQELMSKYPTVYLWDIVRFDAQERIN